MKRISKNVAIIGAGAAGMMCALQAGKRGRSVILIDHARKLAEKIRISGGGRCNFTNRNVKADNYLSNNPHFCRSALARFTPLDFIALIEQHGIGYHEKKSGQLFCDDSSQQIINMLRHECDQSDVTWQMPSHVTQIEYIANDSSAPVNSPKFVITTERNCIEVCALVVATGGLSIPQIGASAFGYQVANQFGIQVTALRPALVGLTFSSEHFAGFKDISGVSVDAQVRYKNVVFRDDVLFTHRGLSGPAILQISSYWQSGESISINLLPGDDAWIIFSMYRQSSIFLTNLLARFLPKRFVQIWCSVIFKQLSMVAKPINQYHDRELHLIADQLHNWQVIPSGTAGYKKAEVTLGGIDTHELSSKTMECKHVSGLYFIGEVVDVTGQLGGFNFQWAWSSGYAAGQAV